MFECLIIGDSIADGIARYRQECPQITRSGVNSSMFNKNFSKKVQEQSQGVSTVIISLGSNDHDGVKTYNELFVLRERMDANRVFWILPNKKMRPQQYDDVKLIALSFGDTVIEPKSVSDDGIHPTYDGYKDLAARTK